MPLYKHVRDDVEKYEDIRTEFKGGIFYMYYFVDGKEKVKKLPFRCGKEQLIKSIQKIRQEIGYYDRKRQRIKDGFYGSKDVSPAFVITGGKND